MDDQKKHQDQATSLTRRSFLVGLGKWSAIVVATVTTGIPAVAAAKESLPGGAPDERIPGLGGNEKEIVEQRCRVWGNAGGSRVWGNAAGCRVWGNAGTPTCRVWGNAGGCRVWGNAGGCRVWGNGALQR